MLDLLKFAHFEFHKVELRFKRVDAKEGSKADTKGLKDGRARLNNAAAQ